MAADRQGKGTVRCDLSVSYGFIPESMRQTGENLNQLLYMGKRQIIFRQDKIGNNQELLNREVNLVTTENRVWHGRVIAVSEGDIRLRDDRSGKHKFAVSEIDRIFLDVKTDY